MSVRRREAGGGAQGREIQGREREVSVRRREAGTLTSLSVEK